MEEGEKWLDIERVFAALGTNFDVFPFALNNNYIVFENFRQL